MSSKEQQIKWLKGFGDGSKSKNTSKKRGRPKGSGINLEKKVRNSHNQALVNLPLTFLEQLGILADFLNGELYTEPLELNILAREIKIKFPKSLSKQLVQSHSQSKGKNQPANI